MEKLGIQEIKDVLAAVFSLANFVDVVKDGVGIGDIGPLVRLIRSMSPAIAGMKSGKLLPELKDLDEAEKADLKAFCQVELNLKEQDLEANIQNILSVMIELTGVLKAI